MITKDIFNEAVAREALGKVLEFIQWRDLNTFDGMLDLGDGKYIFNIYELFDYWVKNVKK